jgi:lysozyme
MTDAVSIAAALARRFEGCYLTPYICPAGVPTIGYGATYYENGVAVKLTDPKITKERAEALLLWMIRKVYLPAVIKLCPTIVNESAGRIAAIIDFTFNLGAGKLKSSTLRKKINAKDWAAVPTELRKWTRGGGKVLRGLFLRREAEIEHV